MNLTSFDIFDTVLLRHCINHETIFDLTALALFPDDENKMRHFAYWRRQAHHYGEKIEDIYKHPGIRDFTNDYTAAYMLKCELNIESNNLYLNPEIKHIIDKSRKNNDQILFLSDMYLPSSFLKGVLIREGAFADGDEIVVSCEHGATKANGKLYEIVAKKLQPVKWKHFGDNKHSDYRQAKKKGVKAKLVSFNAIGSEQRFVDTGANTCSMWQHNILAGASKCARLKLDNSNIAILATNVLVPAYLPFVWHVAKDAISRGLKDIHFVSRDGWIMNQIAENLSIGYLNFHYDYISRKSLIPAFMHICTRDLFVKLFVKSTFIGEIVDHLLKKYFRLDINELNSISGKTIDFNKIHNKEEESAFLDALFDNSIVQDAWKKKNKYDYDLTVEFLSKTGLLGDSVALVDIGWAGSTRLMLNSIRRGLNIPDVFCYYFSSEIYMLDFSVGQYDVYYDYNRKICNFTYLYELYFSAAPNPSVIGYSKQENGEVLPIFSNKKTDNSIIVQTHKKIVKEMTENLSYYLDKLDESVLKNWGLNAMFSLAQFKDAIDFSPLKYVEGAYSPTLVRKLSLVELLKVAIGKKVTDFDPGSLGYTIGYKILPKLWKLRAHLK